jgi:hypothetical protein
MLKTLVSIDLDWLNNVSNPVRVIRGMLKNIPRSVPAIMTVEHHEFLPQLRKWVDAGVVPTPFNLLNIDEHHDYYANLPPFHPDGTEINCGVWGYRIPVDWYCRYTWVNNNARHANYDWPKAEAWLEQHGIKFSTRQRHRLSEIKDQIAAAVFCVSPDYIDGDIENEIDDVVEAVVDHFGLTKAPLRLEDESPIDIGSWIMSPRPVKTKKMSMA